MQENKLNGLMNEVKKLKDGKGRPGGGPDSISNKNL